MNLALEGKSALVTAATGGLGYATAASLAAEGALVTICGRDADRVTAAVARLSSQGAVEATGSVADVSNAGALEALFATTAAARGGLDVLVANAGGPPAGSFLALDEREARQDSGALEGEVGCRDPDGTAGRAGGVRPCRRGR